MCGICGVYEYEQRRPVDRRALDDMLATIQHRGPDDSGVYVEPDLALGMRRLSIIDLAGGKQPMCSEDGSIVLVFNGEIYNYRALHAALAARGHQLTTASDTEVVAHLYEEHGPGCVDELRGMFAFAAWDARRRTLCLARDRLGIKPLYYTEQDGRLIFASEIKAILRYPGVAARLDHAALSTFLSMRYVPAPQTLFAGIRSLPPGHLLLCGPDGLVVRRYWDIPFTDRPPRVESEAAYAEQLAALLHEVVELHLVSDVPFGAFLSGGLDSSLIVALMSQLLDAPVKTFSVGYEGAGAARSELPYARLVAEQYRTDHHEVIVRPGDVIDLAEAAIWHLDQPIGDEAVLPTLMLSRLAGQHVKMVLTGEGGDELFAGYARYAGERLSPLFRPLPGPAKQLAVDLSRRLPGLRGPKLALHALCQPDEVARLLNWFPLFTPPAKAALLAPDVVPGATEGTPEATVAAHLRQTTAVSPLNRMLYLDTKTWLPDDLLARGDKLTMAASIEGRVPLLDHRLVEFAAGLPPHLKLHGLTRKYLLRRVAQPWLPRPILERKKRGFPVPFDVWFRTDLRPFLHDLLSPAAVAGRGLFDGAAVARLLDEHDRGFADHALQLWSLLSLELWHRQFIDHHPVATADLPAVSGARP